MRNTICILICQTLFIAFAYSQVEVERSEEKTVIDGREFYLHSVSQGETLFSISQAYEISLDELLDANPGLEDNLFIGEILRIPIPEEVDKDKYIVHTVKSGETLFSLFRKYNVSEEEFYEHNSNLEKTTIISIGQKLLFPKKEDVETPEPAEPRDTKRFIYHALESGETIFALSRKYDVDRRRILSANPGIDENDLSIGQIIKVPREDSFTKTHQQFVIDSLARLNFEIFSDTLPIPDEILITKCDSMRLEISKHKINIAILLPFEVEDNLDYLESLSKSQREERILPLSEHMTSFTHGALTAIDNFNGKNSKININIYDVGRNNSVLDQLIVSGELNDIDLIIGPAFGSQISFLAENMPNRKAIIVLPFSENNMYIEKYSNVFMMKTSSYYQRKAIVEYAASNKNKNYILITEDDNADNKKFYYNLKQFAGENVVKVHFDGSSINGLNAALHSELENVFILTFRGEYKLFRILSQLFPLKDYKINVIGQEAILNYQTIDAKFFLDNNFTYFSSQHIDYNDSEVINFVQRYRQEFYTEPDEYSFIAYDLINIFVDALLYYDTKYLQCIIEKQPLNSTSGDIFFKAEESFANRSFSNSTLYLYKIDQDYRFNLIFPKLSDDSEVLDNIEDTDEVY